ncbi:MAG TPA: fumarylacetoacetate hydrolase family protein [Rubrivivax sp.]|nr:fumarylacetoacetate hydrolase family protein [Rubrivivax sp.]
MIDAVERLADELLAACDRVHTVPLPSARPGGLSTAQAYAVADALRRRRIERGERPVGWKIGFTNRRIWPIYGVYEPMWAPVWDSSTELLAADTCTLALAGLSQPRLEPEIAFGIGRAPRAGMTLAQLQGCIDWVAHAFEVVHTHYEGWRFTAPDTAADFALHGRLRVGPRVPVQAWAALAADLSALEVELHGDGTLRDRGRGEVVLGGPLQALQALVEAMARTTPHWRIVPGEVVTTGTITDAQPLLPGQRWHTRLSQPRLAGLTLTTMA